MEPENCGSRHVLFTKVFALTLLHITRADIQSLLNTNIVKIGTTKTNLENK